jgi:hypothetical protein
MQERTVVVPDHSHYKGVNDRFALAKPAAAFDYGQRLNFTLNNCGDVPVHAEFYTSWWARSRSYRVLRMPRFDFFRLRATGMVAPGDAMTLRGCNMSEMYGFPVPPAYVASVRDHRRAAFGEVAGWAAPPARHGRDDTRRLRA